MNRLFTALIRSYRRYLSPFLPHACRFTPTCSEYALEAFARKNALHAIGLTLMRILKCHPFHPGGYDPVLPVITENRTEEDAPARCTAGCCDHN